MAQLVTRRSVGMKAKRGRVRNRVRVGVRVRFRVRVTPPSVSIVEWRLV
jgi:hypothetical protein